MLAAQGCKLVRDAIAAGIFNDLGSGSNVDICIITKAGVEYIRPYEIANLKGERANKYTYKRGTTAVTKVSVEVLSETVVATDDAIPMEQ